MCSYLAMFPPALPRYFIEQCSRPGDHVLDPFSGRGTTPLEACVSGRIGIGSDANPLAAVLTASKVRFPSRDGVLARIGDLESNYSRSVARPISAPNEIRLLFDGRRTLPQLLYLRGELSRRSSCDNFILGMLAGILHGNHPKNPRNARTLSISMPNTFSMSPGYIARYKRKHGLRKYPFDCFELLRRRTEHLFRAPVPLVKGRASERDVRTIDEWLKKGSVALTVTSPPYLQVVRYGKYNWIRLWLLGYSVETIDRRLCVEATDKSLQLSDRLPLPRYHVFVEEMLRSLSRVMKPGGVAAIVIGDVSTKENREINLAWLAWKNVSRSVPFGLIEIVDDFIELETKVTKIWGGRRGKATRRDRILLLKRDGVRRARTRAGGEVISKLLQRDSYA